MRPAAFALLAALAPPGRSPAFDSDKLFGSANEMRRLRI